MKKICCFILALFLASFLFSQEIIKNSDKPLSKNAGRILALQETLRIRDDGKEIVFEGPHDLQIGDDGCVYFYDRFNLYKFDNDGNFVFKIIKQGQGPGEASMRTYALLEKDEIVVLSPAPPKIMRFDLNGNLKYEKKVEYYPIEGFLGTIKGKVMGFFSQPKLPLDKRKPEGYMDFPIALAQFSPDFQKIEEKFSFPLKHYVIGSAWWPRSAFIYALKDEKILFVSHTAEYQIIKFNLEQNKIEKIFKRKYRRVKYPPQRELKPRPGLISPPAEEYYYDISKLLVHKDMLWVLTSTKDKMGNRLVDVYDMEGRYIDNFYLQFSEKITPRNFAYGTIAIKGDFLYTIDEDLNGNMSIGKYSPGFSVLNHCSALTGIHLPSGVVRISPICLRYTRKIISLPITLERSSHF